MHNPWWVVTTMAPPPKHEAEPEAIHPDDIWVVLTDAPILTQ